MEIKRTTQDQDGLKVGSVVRTFDGNFSYAVVLGFEISSSDGRIEVVLARPFVYAHDIGTPCASPLFGSEIYRANIKSITSEGERDWAIASDFVRAHR